MSTSARNTVGKLAMALGLALLAACGPEAPAPLPPPPPVVVAPPPEVIPMRPIPPSAASADMQLPQVGPDGVRLTVNAHLNPNEAVWNFRSGWNVAALNCLGPRYQPILDGYKALLNKHSKRLTKVNGELDKQYRAEYGSKATREREAYNTQVYNYFALPPVRDYFCDAALQMSQESLLNPPTDLDGFALAELPKLEAAFEHFFQDMEHYRTAVAAWDARYGPRYGNDASAGKVYASATYAPASSATVNYAPASSAPAILASPASPANPDIMLAQPASSAAPAPQPGFILSAGSAAATPPPAAGDQPEASAPPTSGEIPSEQASQSAVPPSAPQPVFSSEPVVQALPSGASR